VNVQKQKTRTPAKTEATKTEPKSGTDVDLEAIDKLLDEVDALIAESDAVKAAEEKKRWQEKIRSVGVNAGAIQRETHDHSDLCDPCWAGALAGLIGGYSLGPD
jgi:hypothetical protein